MHKKEQSCAGAKDADANAPNPGSKYGTVLQGTTDLKNFDVEVYRFDLGAGAYQCHLADFDGNKDEANPCKYAETSTAAVWLPVGDGPFPVVAFGHGFGGGGDIMYKTS